MEPGPAEATPGRLAELPTWLLSELARRGHHLVSAALAEDGVRKAHFAVLTALAEGDGISQADLGRRVWIDRSDLHALLNELERDGHVQRAPDPEDGRRKLVRMTAGGARALRRWDARVESAQRELLAPLPAKEREAFIRVLRELVSAGEGSGAAARRGHRSTG